jgi:hypothetical protein
LNFAVAGFDFETKRPGRTLTSLMLDLRIALRIALAGFAAGYGAREVISYRRRKAALRRHHELGLDY